MTITQFRKDPRFPSMWRTEMDTNGILKMVIMVLEDAHPCRFPVKTDIRDDLSPTKAALDLGFTRGYSAVLNTIRILAEPATTAIDIGEPTYSPEPVEELK